jgi:aminoglycoside phosphotransferase
MAMLMTPSIPYDPIFASLADALDAERAGRAFGRTLAAAGFAAQTLHCEIERSRIKRGRKALIGYRLRGRDITGNPFDQRVMLTLFPDGKASDLADFSEGQALVDPAFGPATLLVEALGGQAWFFPNDRKVHHIAALLATHEGACEVIHYVPEQGCTLKVTQASGRILFGKCRADDRGSVAARVHEAAKDAAGVRLARVIAHDAECHIYWQEVVAGRPLDPSDVRARPSHWAGWIAAGLNSFHNLTVPDGLKQLTFTSIGETLAKRIKRMETSLPGFAPRLSTCAARLQGLKPEASPLALTHGDLHPGNLLWDGQSFALIDLDTAALAPRALDHGTLVAALIHKSIEADARDGVIIAMISALRNAAQDEIGDARAFDWCVAASLVGERLYRCGTRLKSPRLAVRERLMTWAETLVARHD